MESKTFLSFENKLSNQAVECYYLKILIPNDVVGFIIGKKGSVIKYLEKTYSVKITISCLEDIYPGTDDRVCLISGDFESILSVNDFIVMRVTRMSDAGDNLCFDYDRKTHVERSKQVKFLIPEFSAAKIIGKYGAIIKRMKSISGSFIQISHSSPKLFERCVVVAGNFESNKRACRMIFDKIADDTRMLFYKNISYSRINDPIPNAFPAGPPLAKVGNMHATTEATKGMDEFYDISSLISNETAPSKSQSEFLNAVDMILRGKAYSDTIIKKSKEAFYFLIHNDILNVCSSVIMNSFRSVQPPLGKNNDNKINMAENIRGKTFSSFSDTPMIRNVFSDAQSRCESFMKPALPENAASSSFSSGRNKDATAFNYVSLWNRFPNPLVAINNCAHISVPNRHPGSSELHEDFQFPVFLGKNLGNNVPDLGQKFV